MLRLSVITIFLLFSITAAHAAEKRPTVDELITRAIASLENTSFEGRMRYSDPYGNGQEKLVEIIFLSPSSFRVQPLLSEKQKAGYYYIENSDRLVKVFADGKTVEELPEKSYIIDNLMRRRLLETLAGRSSVSLLRGVFNGEPVWILRDDDSAAGSFSITIHVSETNDYPISLEMTDDKGNRVQYYEMEQIQYLTTAEIPAETFAIPTAAGGSSKAARSAAPEMADVNIPHRKENAAGEETEQQLEYRPRTAKGSGGSLGDDEAAAMQRIPFPLMPGWLPPGYHVNAISPLDYSEGGSPLLVYQLELFNPNNENVISIFQTRSQELEELFTAGKSVGDEGYFVSSTDSGWLVAVFGKISQSQFDQIFGGLEQDDDEALDMISRTLSREELKRWAQDVCTSEADRVP